MQPEQFWWNLIRRKLVRVYQVSKRVSLPEMIRKHVLSIKQMGFGLVLMLVVKIYYVSHNVMPRILKGKASDKEHKYSWYLISKKCTKKVSYCSHQEAFVLHWNKNVTFYLSFLSGRIELYICRFSHLSNSHRKVSSRTKRRVVRNIKSQISTLLNLRNNALFGHIILQLSLESNAFPRDFFTLVSSSADILFFLEAALLDIRVNKY